MGNLFVPLGLYWHEKVKVFLSRGPWTPGLEKGGVSACLGPMALQVYRVPRVGSLGPSRKRQPSMLAPGSKRRAIQKKPKQILRQTWITNLANAGWQTEQPPLDNFGTHHGGLAEIH